MYIAYYPYDNFPDSLRGILQAVTLSSLVSIVAPKNVSSLNLYL